MKKLKLKRETVRRLTTIDLKQVQGGAAVTLSMGTNCPITEDCAAQQKG
jgi:hypothetical protein